jgi:hypothetical protein
LNEGPEEERRGLAIKIVKLLMELNRTNARCDMEMTLQITIQCAMQYAMSVLEQGVTEAVAKRFEEVMFMTCGLTVLRCLDLV